MLSMETEQAIKTCLYERKSALSSISNKTRPFAEGSAHIQILSFWPIQGDKPAFGLTDKSY